MNRLWRGVLVAILLAAPAGAMAAPVWLAVTHTTKARGRSYPEVVKTEAEQAAAPVSKEGGPRAVFGGDGGATPLRTRRLKFGCRGVVYEVPDPFVEDLLLLGVDSSVRASLSTKDAVFTMIGSSGDREYTVHFDFRGGRFFQRILEYGEAHTIFIRTLADVPAAAAQ